MGTYIALLRGVNVGKARRVPMASLRTLLAQLGCTEVRTLLNSGNAVFHSTLQSADACAGAIERAIAQQLALDVPVIVKPARVFAEIVKENPFAGAAADPSRLLIAFTREPSGLSALQGLEALVGPAEGFAIGSHAAYLHCPGGLLESRAGEALLGRVGRSATTRNWATTLKLHALANGEA